MARIYDQLDPIFHPKGIAFIGVSDSPGSFWTRAFWQAIRAFKYEGRMYPVNPRGGEIDGQKIHLSLDEIPESIDYAIVTVSASVTPSVIKDCARKGIKGVHVLTAGFDEVGEKEVAGLQGELARIAREANIRIIGPNCMGIYCPESKISFSIGFPEETGSVGLISQSGGNSVFTVNEGGWKGVRFSKVVSYGNACDLNECDYLEYMLDDPQTKIIALYLEGVKNGRRFFNLLREARNKKPVVLLKGGHGEAGTRAAATHTAMLAGNIQTWETLCRQCNVIKVQNREQMVDILVTLSYLPQPGGRNLVVIGPGGGAVVMLADEFEKRGFRLPSLPVKMREKLLEFTQVAGNMLYNPIDYSQSMMVPGYMEKAVEIVTDWDEVDLCIGFSNLSSYPSDGFELMADDPGYLSNMYATSKKPVAFICENAVLPERQKKVYPIMQNLVQNNTPIYNSFSSAAEALNLVIERNARAGLALNI